MSASPYRTAAERPADPEARTAPTADIELLPVFVVVWLSSLVRVGFALWQGEVFGAEATLAVIAALGLPLLMWDAVCSLIRAGRSPSDT